MSKFNAVIRPTWQASIFGLHADEFEFPQGTYEPGNAYAGPVSLSGYQVALQNPLFGPKPSDEDVNAFVSAYDKWYIGWYENKSEVCLNIPDRDEALRIARQWRQKSIWDWEAMDEIKVEY